MKKFAIILISLFALANIVKAQDEVSEQCKINLSLFNESAKNKQYADAYGPWKATYDECPSANRAIYTRGREILHWKLSQAKTPEDYKQTFDLLMQMYDKRIQYFGSDSRYPTPWILGLKALDYATFVKGDELKKQAYDWMAESINGLGTSTDLNVLSQYIVLSNGLYKADAEQHGEKFIADYLKVNDIMEQLIADPNNKNKQISEQIKQSLDQIFVQSGAAECSTLDKVYGEKVKQNLTNLEYLNTVMSFYRMVGCTEQDVYFAAAVAAHEIQPTAESANGCAQMSYKKGDFNKAIEYYQEATNLEKDNIEKAEYQYKIAQIYYSELNNYPRSRQFALKSLEYNPKNGKAYLLIGVMYANSKDIYDDPVLGKSVYWVAVDKFVRAKQADANLAPDADKMIRTYSNYFPTKEEVFFSKDMNEGESFTVGGWINEKTTVRVAK
ncbi:hypothetical protein D0T49_11410 [Paludibacter sp. 221]|uniref:tetratricopeptide repeat protein n=1 Tax=Paludibacter sp. 221 TaxID=2302939 RepID=UPI0013D8A70E|nr:hypothetical protein [Paludibacter sp. 221]NDV47654.1 hypothetical protein [Paludibacter sp. 221]